MGRNAGFIRMVIAFYAVLFLLPVFYDHTVLLSSFTDDFYYYLKIARNFADGKGLSFATGYITNGYHPLYEGLCILLVKLSDLLGIDVLIIMRIALAILFACGSLLICRVIRPATRFQVFAVILGITAYYFLSSSGMESILVIPLLTMILILIFRQTTKYFLLALLIGISFLARIDSIILTGPLFMFFLIRTRSNGFAEKLGAIGIIAAIVAVYGGCSYAYFGLAMPVSGLAKSVSQVTGVHPDTFASFLKFSIPLKMLSLSAILYCLFALTGEKRYLLTVFLLTLIFFYLQNAVRSDWQIWEWYLYPFAALFFITAECGAGIVLSAGRRSRRLVTATVFYLVFFVSIIYSAQRIFLPPTESIQQAGLAIQKFALANPGVYAMGDRAGVVGYLLKDGVVQLEGLVMDKTYLQRLKKAGKLQHLLNQYNVRYYVCTNPTKLPDSRYIVSEPEQSHGYSPQLVDTISWRVVARMSLADLRWYKAPSRGFETVVFEVPGSGITGSLPYNFQSFPCRVAF